jgi:hypothetical protein
MLKVACPAGICAGELALKAVRARIMRNGNIVFIGVIIMRPSNPPVEGVGTLKT